jgi:hypothetical protein
LPLERHSTAGRRVAIELNFQTQLEEGMRPAFAAEDGWHAVCESVMPRPPKSGPRRNDAPPDAAVDLVALLRILRTLQRELEQLASRLSDDGEEADALASLFADLVERLSAVAGVSPRRRAARSPEEEKIMRAEAEAGVASLLIKRRADGTSEVTVNGRRSFRLPPKLTTLLAVLVASGRCEDDGLLEWRTTPEVATALNKRTGGSVPARSVPKLVFKLRKAFRDAGENWFLIQGSRARGVRVALRG